MISSCFSSLVLVLLLLLLLVLMVRWRRQRCFAQSKDDVDEEGKKRRFIFTEQLSNSKSFIIDIAFFHKSNAMECELLEKPRKLCALKASIYFIYSFAHKAISPCVVRNRNMKE